MCKPRLESITSAVVVHVIFDIVLFLKLIIYPHCYNVDTWFT